MKLSFTVILRMRCQHLLLRVTLSGHCVCDLFADLTPERYPKLFNNQGFLCLVLSESVIPAVRTTKNTDYRSKPKYTTGEWTPKAIFKTVAAGRAAPGPAQTDLDLFAQVAVS